MPFAITWMELGGCSVKQNKTKMNIVWFHLSVKSKKEEKKKKEEKTNAQKQVIVKWLTGAVVWEIPALG